MNDVRQLLCFSDLLHVVQAPNAAAAKLPAPGEQLHGVRRTTGHRCPQPERCFGERGETLARVSVAPSDTTWSFARDKNNILIYIENRCPTGCDAADTGEAATRCR